jgi:hypothetical protein
VADLKSEYHRRIREKAELRERKTESERQKATEESNVEKIVASIEGAIEKLERQADENTPQKSNERRWQKAEVIGLWAAAAVGVTAILVASHDSHEQMVALTDQVKAMNDQVKETKEQRLLLIEQTRANFRREPPTIERIDQKQADGTNVPIGYLITPRWTNAGSTSAKEVLGWYGLGIFNAADGEAIVKNGKCPPVAAPTTLPRPTVIAQGSGLSQQAQVLPYQSAVAASVQSQYIFLLGHMQYRDVYYPTTKEHHDDWCIRLFPNDLETSRFSPLNVEEEAD